MVRNTDHLVYPLLVPLRGTQSHLVQHLLHARVYRSNTCIYVLPGLNFFELPLDNRVADYMYVQFIFL